MIPLKIKLCLSFFIVVKNKALVKAQMKGSFYFKLVEPNRLSTNSSSWGSNSSFNIK